MTYATLELCSGRGSFEAIPRPKLSLDLRAIATRLRERGYDVTDARVMLIARKECEITLASDGRILLKTNDATEASVRFSEFKDAAGLPDVPDPGASAHRIPESVIRP